MGKVLAMKAWRSELEFQRSYKKAAEVEGTCSSSARGEETDRALGLPWQPVYLVSSEPMRYIISKNRGTAPEKQHLRLPSEFHMHEHTWAYLYIHVHIHLNPLEHAHTFTHIIATLEILLYKAAIIDCTPQPYLSYSAFPRAAFHATLSPRSEGCYLFSRVWVDVWLIHKQLNDLAMLLLASKA